MALTDQDRIDTSTPYRLALPLEAQSSSLLTRPNFDVWADTAAKGVSAGSGASIMAKREE
jgi:hypothetical protein